ncbi:MAG: insulinase family protein [Anaerolineae bacterium]|nr:insulinase family protein [Anaerolineae bacterium]
MQAQESPHLNMIAYTLSNGLKVILVQKKSAPTVAVNIWYQVGGAYDPRERSGFAHLFEHMMFEGSANVPKGAFDRLGAAVGGENNAYTSLEYTGYYHIVPAQQLPLALWLDADRLAALDVSQTALDNQRDVVIEEYRQRVSNTAYGTAFQLLGTKPYDYAPYQRPVIGSIEDLNRASMADVRAFHATYYVPNNATLVVAGDIDFDQARRLIDQFFGKIPRQNQPPQLPPYQPSSTYQGQQITVQDSQAKVPALLMAYPIPPRNHADYPALELLQRILGSGTSSRLSKTLVDTGLASSAEMYIEGNRGPGLVQVGLFPNGTTPLAKLSQVYDDEVAKIVKDGVDPKELTKAINQMRSERISSLESVQGLAESIQDANFYFGDPQAVFGELDRFRKVTSGDLQRVATQYLTATRRFTITVATGKGSAVATEPAQVATPAAVSATEEPQTFAYVLDQKTPPPPLDAGNFTLPAFNEKTLDNGLQVVVVARPDLPLLSMKLILPGGASAVPANMAGLASLTAETLTRGTKTRSGSEIADTIEQVGGQINAGADQDSLVVSVSTLSENTKLAFDLLGDVVLNPTFPDNEVQTNREILLTNLQFSLSSASALARRTFNSVVYGAHPYGSIPTEQTIKALTRDAVVQFYNQRLNPQQAILIIAGDISAEDALANASATFGGWKASGSAAKPAYPTVQPLSGTKIYLVDRPGSTQVQFVMGLPGVPGNTPERQTLRVLNEVLGGSFSSRLNRIVREEKGYTYGIGSAFSFPVDRGVFLISMATRNDVADKALTATLDEVKTIRTTAVPADELNNVKSGLIGRFALGLETSNDLINQIASLKLRGLPLDILNRYNQDVSGVNQNTILKAAQQYLDPDKFVIVAVGDASAVKDRLSKIAPVEVVTPK